jgi:D-alanyl-lipoteichoic acid acyltransferase DltB (MBOAT superfamily)
MSYCSPIYFLVILPVFILAYGITPKKHRSKVLILLSYVFFWLISNKLLVYLIISTLSIHHFGIWLKYIKIERDNKLAEAKKEDKKDIKETYNKKEKRVLLLAVILHIGCLVLLKYTPFFLTNVNSILKLLHISLNFNIPKLLIPIGISFYTLQAVSYITDVHNEKIEADTNLVILALWMSFFPQIM